MKPVNATRIDVHPCGITAARVGVARWHRHHRPPVGGLVAFEALAPSGWPCGYAVVGRPVSFVLQARGFVEVTRVATDGTPNACSALYGAASRWAKRKGSPILTYTLDVESGGSLRGAGWVQVGDVMPPASWGNAKRPRHARPDEAHAKRRWMPAWCADAWVSK